jgi:hypothetical protein
VGYYEVSLLTKEPACLIVQGNCEIRITIKKEIDKNQCFSVAGQGTFDRLPPGDI